MRKIKRDELKKKLDIKKHANHHKIYRVSSAIPARYGIIIPRAIVEKFKVEGVYYSLNVEENGKVFILKSGCRLNLKEEDYEKTFMAQ